MSEAKEPIVCDACGAVNQHETAECPYALHHVAEQVRRFRRALRDSNELEPLGARWLMKEMDRWAARWLVARNAAIAAQYRTAEAIEIRLLDDEGGCANCAHFLSRISTCMGPKLQRARQLDAGVYVPPWCPGFSPRSDEP